MKKILSTSESINPQQLGTQLREIHATGEAVYDERRKELRMTLDCRVRESRWGRKDRYRRLNWLPKKQSLREPMPAEEALPAARSIFHTWTERIRRQAADQGEVETREKANAQQHSG